MLSNVFVSKYELVFKIPGSLYQHILVWQQVIDLEVIRYQIERFGRAVVVRFKGKKRLQQIGQVPGLGEAEPYYGEIGGAYRYLFRPQQEGCTLWVENIVSGRVNFHVDPIPPLKLHVPDKVELRMTPNGDKDPLRLHIGYIFLDQTKADGSGEVIFTITQDIYPLLMAWERYGKPLENYIYRFNPTNIGCFVHVQHIESSEILDLTRHVKW